MNTHHFATRLFRFLNVPARILLVVAFLFGSIYTAPVRVASAAAGSTRVMCENDPSLVGCWRMEEGSGNIIKDGSPAYLNDGSITGLPTFVVGQIGNAIKLSGSGQYAIITDKPNLDLTSAMTLAAWVKPERTATQNILKKTLGTTTANGYELSLSSAGKVFVRLNGNALYRIDSTTSYPATGTTWIHIAATFDGSTIKLYINGNQESGDKAGVTIVANSTNLGIGAEPAASPINFFQGAIDDARIYNRALSAIEIAALATNTPPGDTTAPAAPTGIIPAAGDGQVSLTWTAPADPDVAGYNIYSSTATPVDTATPVNSALVTTEAYTVIGLTNDTPYYFTVKAVDTSNNVSAAADEVNETPEAQVNTPPAAPTGLSAIPGNTLVNLSWNANTEIDLAGYNIYRSPTAGVPLTSPINGGTLVTGTTYTDTGRVNGQVYYYVVTAVDTGSLESGASNEVNATPTDAFALQFDGTDDYVTFGPVLNATSFTLEAWVKRATGGVTMTTGSLGLDGTAGRPLAYPVLTKGMGQGETPANINMNYFLGITSTGMIGADFEDNAGGVNHPAWGTTTVPVGEWHHISATYNGTCWALYYDGRPDTLNGAVTACPGATPEFTSIQRAGLSAGIGSDGRLSGGYFSGLIDEARVWNVARTPEQILADVNNQLFTGTGLIARWGMGEGTGTTIASSVGTFPGTLTNGPVWVTPGAPFNIAPPTPPAAPSDLGVASTSSSVLTLSWTDNSDNETGFEIERSTTGSGGLFTLLTTTAAGAVTNINSGLTPVTEYCYRVRAVNGAGQSDYAGPTCASTQAEAPAALQFDGTNDYVTFGNVAGLGVTNFTLETWFNWTGGGTAMTTSGTQGLPSVYPLISKGRGEADGSNVDMNYFLGIDSATKALAVDFEDTATGMNWPFVGTREVTTNTWHHAAVTYDSVTAVYTLYLDGNIAGTRDIGNNIFPRADSIQHAGIATAMTSTGAPSGYFQGTMDEVRIWNVARSQEQIRADINNQLSVGSGLVARWGLNEGTGTTAASSVGSFPGTLTNGPVWVTPGAPFNLTFDTVPPAAPTGLFAIGANASVSLDWDDNVDPDLAGYNVYRGTAPGVYTKINSTLVTTSAYSDTGLTNGTEYYYIVRAVDGSGNESLDSNQTYAIPQLEAGSALHLNPASTIDTYVTFGDPAKLDLATFTIETWFKRTGTGTSITTGSGGIPNAVPLVAHGAQQAEGGTIDANWMLVIDDSTDVIAADFEDMASGANHPVYGVTPITDNIWHHAAATYDGTTWKLYLDGKLEKTLAVGAAPRSDTTQHASLGTMLNTSGGTNGFFQGVLDEARVWNRALTHTELLASINQQLTSGSGLVARWGLNEGTGSVVGDSIAPAVAGTISGSNFAWVPGAPFNLDFTPGVPTLVAPADMSTGVPTSTPLTVHVTDPLNVPLTVSFYGRVKGTSVGPDFSLIAIPDTQYYASTYPSIYNAQMDWIVANKTSRNIPFVVSLGDNVDVASDLAQWSNATAAWDRLTAGNVRYGLALGNHDGAPDTTGNFNTNFASRLGSAPNSCVNMPSDFDNIYCTFTASGMDFIVVFIEYGNQTTGVLNWANGVLSSNSARRAIVVTHDLLSGNSFTSQGLAIYEALKGNPNLFLMLGGHLDTTGQRSDVFEGRTVYSLRSDYQFVDSRQSGYLRIMRFSPADNMIYFTTYSPNQAKYLTDSSNEFSLPYAMDGVADYTLIGTTTVPSGSDATVTWSGLAYNEDYEWYAAADNGGGAAVSPTWSFTTGSAPANTAPTTSGISNVTVDEDAPNTTIDLWPSFADAQDTDSSLVYTVTANTNAALFTSVSITGGQNLVLDYAPDAFGTSDVTVRATDTGGLYVETTFTVTVTAVNDPPQVTNPGARTDPEGTLVNLAISATDVDGPSLAYSATNLPTGLTIDPATGVISGTIAVGAAASSPYASSVTVSDGTTPVTVNFTWTIAAVPPGLTCVNLDPKPMVADTSDKPQSKVWQYDGSWYAVFPTNASGASSAGTWVWKLENTTWTEVVKLSDRTDTHADALVAGSLVHILLWADSNTQLASIEYVSGAYQLWPTRPALVNISIPGSESATIALDSAGRMWLATRRVVATNVGEIVAYYSDSPYSTWSGPITLVSGVIYNDDISVITALPNGTVGVFWGNENTAVRKFGFRYHIDGQDPTLWSEDEVPAGQSYIPDIGTGMADDHHNVAVASDGTLYVAVKTSYDTAGYPKMALLVRRPSGQYDGTWDDLYGVDESGTRPLVLLDEVHGFLTYIYTQSEGYNNIVYRQSSTGTIAFDARKTLRTGSFNNVSSMKANYNNEFVVIYASSTEVAGQRCYPSTLTGADLAITKTDGVTTARRGDTLTYTIQAVNNGPQAVSAATVVDTFPAALTGVSWTCSGANGGSCAVPSGTGNLNTSVNLPFGASVTFTVSATVASSAIADISNTASISTPAGVTDPNPGNNTATDVDTLTGIPSLCEIDPTLVGCWQMEENGGSTLLDGSTYLNNAALTGAPAWAPGKRGSYSIDLDGTSQYGSVPGNASLNLTDQLTLATWIRPEQYATQDLVKKATNGGVDGYELTLATTKTDSSSQRPFFRINQATNGDTYRINAATMYPIDGSWMHVAATYDGTTMKLYVNGVLEASMTPPAGTLIATNTLPLTLGAQDGATASRFFMGGMDDTRIYNRALSLAEIQVLAGVTTNSAPVITQADPQEVSMSQNGAPTPFALTLDATDADGDTLTWSILSPASHGTATASGSGLSQGISYTPALDYVGTDSFVVRVSDGRLGSDTLTVNVTVVASAITVTGTVSMQGRTSRAGVPVTLTGTTFGPYSTTSIEQISGNLVFSGVMPGEYTITTLQPRCLNLVTATAKKFVAPLAGGRPLNALELKSGNAVWSDNVINIQDAGVVGFDFNKTGDRDADVNFDGVVNIQDLSLVGGNFDLTSNSAYAGWIP